MIADRPSFLKLSGISFVANGIPILSDMSFEIACGEYVGLVGPNGGGKTTLLRMVLGLERPTRGTIAIHGTTEALEKQRAKIGYVPQRISLDAGGFPATVKEVVGTGCTQRSGRITRSRCDTVVTESLERLDITHLSSKLIGELSGGERQKVYIARALAAGATALILDEPTVGIDAPSTESFYALLAELNQKEGMTVILVSHDIDVVAREARTVLCVNGRLICHGRPKDALTEEYMRLLYGREMRFVYHDPHLEPDAS